MAGAGGFEPTNAGTKTRCLTTWRRPSVSLHAKRVTRCINLRPLSKVTAVAADFSNDRGIFIAILS